MARSAAEFDGRSLLAAMQPMLASPAGSAGLMPFRRQWLVSDPSHPGPSHWKALSLCSGHVLFHDADLRVASREAGGRQVVVLGIAASTMAPEQPALDFLATFERGAVESWLARVVGRYAVLLAVGDELYVYTDPAAMMAVFHRKGRAASTPALLGAHTGSRAVEPSASDGEFFTGATCSEPGVHSLMANHELALNRGTVRRFWLPQVAARSESAVIEDIRDLLQRIIRGYRANGRLLLSLTGGRDSRVTLAAARPFAVDARFFTIDTGPRSVLDVRYARHLAAAFNLRHEIVPCDAVSPLVVRAWNEIGHGMCPAASRLELGGVARLAADGRVHVGGMGGELLRANLWTSPSPLNASASTLVSQTIANPSRSHEKGVEQWRRSVPDDLPPATVFDLFEFEQRTGRIAGIAEACSSLFYETVSLFNSRELFDLVQSLPLRVRYSGQLNTSLVQVLWPELLDVPMIESGRPWWKSTSKRFKMAALQVLNAFGCDRQTAKRFAH